MALPWWLRGALTGGAALLKARLKRIKEGSEVVGKARKVLLAKLTKQLKALKDKKPKDKEPEKPKEKRTMSRKKLMEHGEREAKRDKEKMKIDSVQEEFDGAAQKYNPNNSASVKRYRKAKAAMKRRDRIVVEDLRARSSGRMDSTPAGTRGSHSITGKIKGDTDLRDFSDSLLKQDIRVAKHVRGLQKLKRIRDHRKKTGLKGGSRFIKKFELDPKLAKSAKADFQRIQKKKDRNPKKDAKKKGKQGEVKPKSTMKTTKTGRYRDDVLAKRKRAGRRIISEEQYLIEQRRH